MPNRIKVLIVEDDEGYALTLRDHMEQRTEAKYKVEVATTMAGAVERLHQGNINCVLLDLTLPDSKDISAVELINRIAAAGPDVGIIVLTGWGDVHTERSAREAGADEFLAKPASPSEISKRIQYVTIDRNSQRERHAMEATLAELASLLEKSAATTKLQEVAEDTNIRVRNIEHELKEIK